MCCWIYFLSWWPVGRHSTRLNSLFHSYYYYYSAAATAAAAPYTSSAAELRDFTNRRTLPHPFWGFTWIRQKGDTFFPLSLGSAEGFKWRGPIECIKNWRPHPRERRQRGEKRFIPISLLLDFASSSSALPRWHFDDDDNERPSVRPSVRCLFVCVCILLFLTCPRRTTNDDDDNKRRRRRRRKKWLFPSCWLFAFCYCQVDETWHAVPCRSFYYSRNTIRIKLN